MGIGRELLLEHCLPTVHEDKLRDGELHVIYAYLSGCLKHSAISEACIMQGDV